MSQKSDTTTAKVLSDIGTLVMQTPVKVRADYIEGVVVLGIALMRGAGGDEFVRGFLEAALADLDLPSEVYTKSTVQ